ncbi:hypothetical protein A2949_00070 [Candidatus Adlerbacteria bacterium RIFCSPLOWO2_01_FULL_54_21b]|uniref:Uncharacterized protein n=1 Tax=Candidatus Adlerbacteria bacterium RIFCSPLOWO2_01_FULL_54_21b TaxID=1797245 RepID=A0A1F4XYD2_9BACT|nr:MAG: hypothetical protein A2949_00070 [Candidatus Adlerbacteria bacterium RIFCSPLOWO2_01_FULL_54_21b]
MTDHAPMEQVRAAVADIRHGFIVTYPLEDYGELTRDRSITFTPRQWQGDERDLYPGVIVDLYGVTLSARGWRAREARPVTPRVRKQETRSRENANGRLSRQH